MALLATDIISNFQTTGNSVGGIIYRNSEKMKDIPINVNVYDTT